MINNFFCLQCKHEYVCKIKDKLIVFDEEAKKPLGVEITLDKCSNFELQE